MARLTTRRAAITALGATLGGVFGLEYLLRRIYGSPAAGLRLANAPGAMMGVDPADMPHGHSAPTANRGRDYA